MRHEFDAIRRSSSVGNGITRDDVDWLLELCDRLVAEREQIRRVLDELAVLGRRGLTPGRR